MLPEVPSLPLGSLVAFAAEHLAANGYRVVRDASEGVFPGEATLLAEDEYSVLAIVGFETWSQLEAEWPDAQAELVDLLARRLARAAPKSWDGYLLLLCSTPAPDSRAVSSIERDTTRLRKIVASADRVRTTSDFVRFLDIFTPLSLPADLEMSTDILEQLPSVLAPKVDPAAVQVVIEAFRKMDPPLERLHEWKHP